MKRRDSILVAVAGDKALALEGTLRGEVWVVKQPPGDGLWFVEHVEISFLEARWKQWIRASKAEVLAYRDRTQATSR